MMSNFSANSAHHSRRGFTLIELVITIAILGILAAIVIPSYNAQMREARRSDAITTLLQISQQLERCRSDTNAYTAGNPGCIDFDGTDSDQGFYRITTVQNDLDFLLTAEPAPDSPQEKDKQCAQFTLDQTGTRTAQSDPATNPPPTDECWR